MSNEDISALVKTRDVLQQMRIAFGNRLAAIDRGEMNASATNISMYQEWHNRFSNLEQYADADITRASEEIPIIERMILVKGIGRILAAQLVAVLDISKAETISSLWRYCGYGVEDGRAERPQRGQKLRYNPHAKTLCWNIGVSFMRSSSPYREVYDSAKEKYTRTRPEWTKARIHNAAQRIMVKRFLSHLWLVWRELEGLSTRPPYVQEYMGHTTIDSPAKYGW